MTIAFLLNFMPNPRIKRRIELAKHYGKVDLICWNREKDMQSFESIDNVDSHIIKLKVGESVFHRVISLFKVRKIALKELTTICPDIIHVQGLDILGIALEYKRKSKKQITVVYEVADLHKYIVDKQKNIFFKFLQIYLRKKEIKYCSLIDLLVVTSEKYYSDHFCRFVPSEKVIYIPNIPNLSMLSNYVKKKDGKFTIGFLGVVRYKNEIKMLLKASQKCDVDILVAGYEQGDKIIESACASMPNVNWVGRFDFSNEAAYLYSKCDAIYAVYDSDLSNVRVALPNKLYEAVYLELPIIVSTKTYLSELVESWNVGYSVDHNDLEGLVLIINKLKDQDVMMSIQESCQKNKHRIDPSTYNQDFINKIISIRRNAND